MNRVAHENKQPCSVSLRSSGTKRNSSRLLVHSAHGTAGIIEAKLYLHWHAVFILACETDVFFFPGKYEQRIRYHVPAPTGASNSLRPFGGRKKEFRGWRMKTTLGEWLIRKLLSPVLSDFTSKPSFYGNGEKALQGANEKMKLPFSSHLQGHECQIPPYWPKRRFFLWVNLSRMGSLKKQKKHCTLYYLCPLICFDFFHVVSQVTHSHKLNKYLATHHY